MNYLTLDKFGGASLILGSLLLTAYSVLFPLLLPVDKVPLDFVRLVIDPHWVELAWTAFAGVLLMLVGFYAVYTKIREEAGLVGALGFLFIEAAYLLQACKVTWELFLYPVIATHPESAFLLRDLVIKHDPGVGVFRLAATVTIFVGILLFCYTLYRSSAYPKSAAGLIFVGALVYGIGPMFSIYISVAGIFTLSIGCLLIGLKLFRVEQA